MNIPSKILDCQLTNTLPKKPLCTRSAIPSSSSTDSGPRQNSTTSKIKEGLQMVKDRTGKPFKSFDQMSVREKQERLLILELRTKEC